MTPHAAPPLNPPLPPGPHIRRRDDRCGRGWVVRVQRRDFKVERLFSDGVYGGAAQALDAAQAWRNQQPWYRPRTGKPFLMRVAEITRCESLPGEPGRARLYSPTSTQPIHSITHMTKTPASPDHPVGIPLLPGPHIRRREDAHGRAWLVRIVRKDIKQERMFSDGTYGGTAQALAAAQQWRDAQPWYRPHGHAAGNEHAPYKPDAAFAQALGKGLASALASPPSQLAALPKPLPGTCQIDRYISLLLIDGRQRPCAFWRVSWTDAKNKTWTRKFSVNFWGEAVAHQKALHIHAQHQRQIRPDTAHLKQGQWRHEQARRYGTGS